MCFTKIKLPLSTSPPSPSMSPTNSISSSTSQTQDAQNYPSTLMPTINSTTCSPSPILIKNFNSLYESNSKSLNNSPSFSTLSNLSEAAIVADLSTVLASQRFFFSSPGQSNSIIQSTSTSTSTTAKHEQTLLMKSIAVPTFSPDPYTDFRRSMQEMVEARELLDVKKLSYWEFLHELLLCYLALNPKTTHKFIISAFSDLLVSLLPETQLSGCHGNACN